MLLSFILVIVYGALYVDSYYVVEQFKEQYGFKKDFKVYWNVPTFQCKSKRVPFENLYEKFGIIQNEGDGFNGEKGHKVDKVAVMYHPGDFPYLKTLKKEAKSNKYRFVNGGLPQDPSADLEKHLEMFTKDMNKTIPDKNFDGIGVIDFERWKPVLRQHFTGTPPYKELSYDMVRQEHWWMPKNCIEAEATHRFESSARLFMETTLLLARVLRPRAKWGYYAFPYCYNNFVADCASGVMKENDILDWLWRDSTALFPSLYSSNKLSTSQLVSMVKGRIKEAARVTWGSPILPYIWFRYREGGFLSQIDLKSLLRTLYESSASGFIIWGGSDDVNTPEKCKKLLDYINNIMGPAIAKYTKTTLRDEMEYTYLDDYSDEDNIENNEVEIVKSETNEVKTQLNSSDSNKPDINDTENTILQIKDLINFINNSKIYYYNTTKNVVEKQQTATENDEDLTKVTSQSVLLNESEGDTTDSITTSINIESTTVNNEEVTPSTDVPTITSQNPSISDEITNTEAISTNFVETFADHAKNRMYDTTTAEEDMSTQYRESSTTHDHNGNYDDNTIPYY